MSELVLDLRAVPDSMKRADSKEWLFDIIPAGIGPQFKWERSAWVLHLSTGGKDWLSDQQVVSECWYLLVHIWSLDNWSFYCIIVLPIEYHWWFRWRSTLLEWNKVAQPLLIQVAPQHPLPDEVEISWWGSHLSPLGQNWWSNSRNLNSKLYLKRIAMLLHHSSSNHTCKSIYLKGEGVEGQRMRERRPKCKSFVQKISSWMKRREKQETKLRKKIQRATPPLAMAKLAWIDKHNRFNKAYREWSPYQHLRIKKIYRWWKKETKWQEKKKIEPQENTKISIHLSVQGEIVVEYVTFSTCSFVCSPLDVLQSSL